MEKKMTNARKVKGNNAERDACKILQEIFNQPFQRVPSSGAMLGGLNNPKAKNLSKNQQQILSNDIIPPDCFQNLSIEIKSRINFLFHKIYSKDGCIELNKWIDQVEDSGIDMKKAFPMICFKINNKGWFICLWESKLGDIRSSLSYTRYVYNNESYIIADMKDYLNENKDELIKIFEKCN